MKIRLSELKKIVRDTLREMHDSAPETKRSLGVPQDFENLLTTMWDDEPSKEEQIPDTVFDVQADTEREGPMTMRSRR